MTDEARAARNAYRREWSRKNKDKLKEYQERYWAKKAEELHQQKVEMEKEREDSPT